MWEEGLQVALGAVDEGCAGDGEAERYAANLRWIRESIRGSGGGVPGRDELTNHHEANSVRHVRGIDHGLDDGIARLDESPGADAE